MKKSFLIACVIGSMCMSISGCTNKDTSRNINQEAGFNEKVDTKTLINKEKQESINTYHPIIFRGQLLGGSKNNEWFTIDKFNILFKGNPMDVQEFINDSTLNNSFIDLDLAGGGEEYRLYKDNIYMGMSIGNKPTFSSDGYGNEYYSVNMKDEIEYDIAINGDWNAFPRTEKQLTSKDEVSIDIDGDGKEEKFSIRDAKIEEKDYEGNVLSVDGKKIEVEINGKIITVDEFIVDHTYVSKYKFWMIDLNGDGILEILVLLEGHNTTVSAYEINNNKTNKVLGYYIGD